MVNQTYAITSVSEHAAHFFNDAADKHQELFAKFPSLEAIHDTVRAELTSADRIEPVPLFGLSMAFGGNYQGMSADHSESFSPNIGGGNSGKGSQGRA